METIWLIVALVLIAAAIVLIVVFRPKHSAELPRLQQQLQELQATLARIESNLKEEFRNNREENASLARNNREELNNTLRIITEQSQRALTAVNQTLAERIDAFNAAQKESSARSAEHLDKLTHKVEEKLENLNRQAKQDNIALREAMTQANLQFQERFEKNINALNELQKDKFGELEKRQAELVQHTESKLDLIRSTVAEKLEKTLSERLGQSFETVGKQLIEVQKGLGEMQSIATDVGGLKRVLSNVKLRGGMGEMQLAMLLEQILAPGQYEANVRTKAGSNDPVEFAIKLPGRSEDESAFVYLPIDAKFPKDTYEHLINAYENAVPDDIEAAVKLLENTIRKMAKDIRDKYIDPPHTTDFAIMFLPFEGIYAEVIRRSNLVDQLRDEFKITVAGPTTLAALLNSLQMGFRTLALQKRSSEVWTVLSSVKTEFEKFGGLLEKAQKNIQTGLDQLEGAVSTRTRAIQRKLRNVGELPAADVAAPVLLSGEDAETDAGEDDETVE